MPSLKIIKKINGDDANTAPGVSVVPGSDMAITFDVINDGKVDLLNVKVTDSVIKSGIKCTGSGTDTIALLKAGTTVTCTATIKAPAEGGMLHHNVAKATGTPPEKPKPPRKPGEPVTPDTPNTPVESPEDPGFATTTDNPPPPPEPVQPPVKMPETGANNGTGGWGAALVLAGVAGAWLARRKG